ncbi:hypothetical protein [Epilithonimonas hispanica]|uniref:Uncharacterized protein n=1 Tax=Epilithonimonas hispanica TaxID=358687 RepID=A0A3D9CVX2_9FLAO|nr:hypothetical protein [Epilithonimonas hispanica]REC69930.1 hypothetical protein DRF58_11560 [Epilithonimonas hispanica]
MKIFKLIFFLIICIISIISFNQSFLINNGDYTRITRVLRIDYPLWSEVTKKTFSIDHSIQDSSINSTYQLVCNIITKAHLFCNQDSININTIKVTLYLLFLSGCFFLIYKNKEYLYSLIIIPIAMVYHTILNSFYQEAIIYAILPLFIYSVKEKLNMLFLILAIAIILAKPQMILISFYFLAIVIYSKNSLRIKYSYFTILILTILFSFKFQSKENQDANKYNRYYNGIGYSTQDVFKWPTKNFNERINYYSKNKLTLIEKSKEYFDSDIYSYAGSTTYPDLYLLREEWS